MDGKEDKVGEVLVKLVVPSSVNRSCLDPSLLLCCGVLAELPGNNLSSSAVIGVLLVLQQHAMQPYPSILYLGSLHSLVTCFTSLERVAMLAKLVLGITSSPTTKLTVNFSLSTAASLLRRPPGGLYA